MLNMYFYMLATLIILDIYCCYRYRYNFIIIQYSFQMRTVLGSFLLIYYVLTFIQSLPGQLANN